MLETIGLVLSVIFVVGASVAIFMTVKFNHKDENNNCQPFTVKRDQINSGRNIRSKQSEFALIHYFNEDEFSGE